jgi:hypothetical protein
LRYAHSSTPSTPGAGGSARVVDTASRTSAERGLQPEALAALGRAGELPRWRGCGMAGLIERDPALAEAVAAAGNARTGLRFHPENWLA